MTFRKVLFWMHLIAGVTAGAIILLMSITGVALTYERQMLARADRGPYRAAQPAGAQRLSIDELVTRLRTQGDGMPRGGSVVVRANPEEPVEISAGGRGGKTFYVNPYDGRVLGTPNTGMHEAFQKLTAWHRWLAMEGEGRQTARAITGACNTAFLFIVLSGIYLWLPKLWTARHIRPIAWFKGGLAGKARDFNWHNVFGIWTAIPLAIVVASGMPMSYKWANDLLYTMTGSPLPAAPQQQPQPQQRQPRRPAEPVTVAPLFASVQQRTPDWQSISVRIPDRPGPVVFAVDTGDGGQPQKKSTVTIDSATGEVKKVETFADNTAGRRLRMWSRFAHTGEYYGIVGQTIAGIASFAGVMLVWTGISLSLRRFAAWRARTQRSFGSVATTCTTEPCA